MQRSIWHYKLTEFHLYIVADTNTLILCSPQLQTVVIEQSDELDRCNAQLDLVKQLKHYCLVGDAQKCALTCHQFREQAEQLIEACKMLNQVAPTNKMKITTKTLAIWFEANCDQLVAMAQSLSELPRSRVLKDCTWAYMQGKLIVI